MELPGPVTEPSEWQQCQAANCPNKPLTGLPGPLAEPSERAAGPKPLNCTTSLLRSYPGLLRSHPKVQQARRTELHNKPLTELPGIFYVAIRK